MLKSFFIFLILYSIHSCYSKDLYLVQKIERYIENSGIVGISIVLFEKSNNKLEYINLGYEDLNSRKPITEKTPIELASLSKAFTGLVIAKFIIQKKLRLAADISDYILNFKEANIKLSLRDLVCHCSQIPWYAISLFDQVDTYTGLIEQLLSKYKIDPRKERNFEYSTVNYALLGYILELIEKRDFKDIIKKEVFVPLHMQNSSFPSENRKNCVGYKIDFMFSHKYSQPLYNLNFPAGYVISTAEDMGKWLKFHMNTDTLYENILEKAAALTHQPFLCSYQNGEYYGFGWFIDNSGNIYHTGRNPNFSTYIKFNKDYGVVVLSNTASDKIEIIGDFIMNYLTVKDSKISFVHSVELDTIFSIITLILLLIIVAANIRMKKLISSNKLFYSYFCSLIFLSFGIFAMLATIVLSKYGINFKSVIIWAPYSLLSVIYETIFITCEIILLVFTKHSYWSRRY